MLRDIHTMIWKEWQELLRLRGSRRSSVLSLLFVLLVFGVIFPVQAGRAWTETWLPLALWCLVPPTLISMIIADSFAGERERYTLETLLASRLPDRAILLGKVSAILLYTWCVTQLILLIALIPVNIMYGGDQLFAYSGSMVASGVLLSFCLGALMTLVGVLVSLRSATVRQAQQLLGGIIFVIIWAVPLGANYLWNMVPETTQASLLQLVSAGDLILVVAGIAGAVMVLNVCLFLLAQARFQRQRLIVR